MDISDEIQSIADILYGRGVPIDEMFKQIRKDKCSDTRVLLDLVGALYDGLAHGNWPPDSAVRK